MKSKMSLPLPNVLSMKLLALTNSLITLHSVTPPTSILSMTNLSPAAQAVDDATCWAAPSRVIAAAALRAAADQVTPGDKELSETYLAGYYAEKNRQGPACQAAGLRAVLAKWGKDPLLAIADELEAHG
jgi:hypothetical protein